MFSGADYRAPRDQARLSTQLERVKDAMIDGQWRSLAQIAELAQAPQTSVSAQLRNLRKLEFGSWLVDRRHIDRGLYEYRLRAQVQADLFEQKKQKPTRAEMREGFEQLSAGSMDAEEYDDFVRDTVNFLAYIAEPIRSDRRKLGVWVIMFLIFFFILSTQLKKQIWKDVQ